MLPPLDWLASVKTTRLFTRLEAIYRLVPATRCPSGCSACCRLSERDWAANLAVMYPLYRIEYFRIADYVFHHFPKQKYRALLAFQDERPRVCPFLDQETGACAIYPVRPYLCRTYGILTPVDIEKGVVQYQRQLPGLWLNSFRDFERHITCADLVCDDEEGKAVYLDERIRGNDLRRLQRLNQQFPQHPREASDVFRQIVRNPPISAWSWGGFNTLLASDEVWFAENFAAYWQGAELPCAHL